VIHEPHPKLQEPTTEDLHIIGATQRAAISDATIVSGKGVTPFSQPAELHMRLVKHALDPIGPREPEASREPALDHCGARRSRRSHVDNGGVGRSRGAACPDASLVDEDNVRASFSRRDRRPATGGAAAYDKNVG
jgi:hypothetical protein